MKIALFPGSFNPFHEGHKEIVEKALKVFDKVIVAQGVNSEKTNEENEQTLLLPKGATFISFSGMLSIFAKKVKADAIIKGLRNGQDLEYERAQQYWNEDLGLEIPIFYIISSRNLMHISSSAIRIIKKLRR